jgi:UBX domain-containing protein 1
MKVRRTNILLEDLIIAGELFSILFFDVPFPSPSHLIYLLICRRGGSGLAVEGPPPSGRRPNPSSRSDDPFDAIVRQAQNSDRPPAEANPTPGANNITIALYRNGFVVNDGPLRDLTSPESKAFLAALERGDLPPELRSTANPGVVDVQLMDKRQQDYTSPPQPAYVAYSGEGSRIGSTSSSDAFLFSADILSDIPALTVDESQPTTTVQVKTHNGKKLRLK